MSPAISGLLVGLAPLALLVIALIFGRYPGERTLDRLRGYILSFRAVRPGQSSSPARFGWMLPACGGRLLACSVSVRGPPFGQ